MISTRSSRTFGESERIAIRIGNNIKTAQKSKMKTRHDRRGFTNVTFWYIKATQNRGGSNFENEIEIEVGELHE